MNTYALHDFDLELKKQGAFIIPKETAQDFNKKGYGIFFTPNVFEGGRKIENLKEIRFWFADLDQKDKNEQLKIIKKLLLKPTTIIESKRGYHCYWKAISANICNFQDIMKGIIKKIGADEAVKGCNRIMRMPGFYHYKEKDNPFLVQIIEQNKEAYNEKEMLYAFHYKKPIHRYIFNNHSTDNKDEMLNPLNWDRIFWLDKINNGCRNNELTRITFWLKDSSFESSLIKDTIHAMNQRLVHPLSEEEVNLILKGKV